MQWIEHYDKAKALRHVENLIATLVSPDSSEFVIVFVEQQEPIKRLTVFEERYCWQAALQYR
jgi:hypothetical protein